MYAIFIIFHSFALPSESLLESGGVERSIDLFTFCLVCHWKEVSDSKVKL